MRHRILLGCLVLSGFSGLAYELLWTRLLSFTFGSTSLSFSAVLAVFFGGLALGAWAAGRRAAALRRPMRVYAAIEIGIGVFGILLYPLLRHLDVVFASLDPGVGLAGALIRFAVSVPILIVPTFLMGATLPVVCMAMIHRDEDSGRGMALIYGVNTLGAFLGAYLVTYHMLPGVGVFRSLLITVGANFLAGAIAFAVDRTSPALERRESVEASGSSLDAEEAAATGAGTPYAEESPAKILRVAATLTFFSGFSIIGLEVVWARLFSSLLQGTIYGIGAVLICFLVGIALGSLLLARRLPADRDVGLWFAALQTITIGSVLLLCHGMPAIAYALGNLAVPSESLGPQHLQLLVVFLSLLVPTVCSGASFPLLVKVVESRARRTGRALGSMYAANTVGSILGSLVTGFLLIPVFGSVGAISLGVACLGLTAALGGALLSSRKRRLPGLAVGALALVLVALYDGYEVRLIAVGFANRNESFEEYRSRYRAEERTIVYFAEGREATIAVFDDGNRRSLKINGLGQGSRARLSPHHNLESVLVAAVPFVHVAEPSRALVVGLGAGTTLELLREFGVPQANVVELEPRVVDAVEVLYQGESPVDSSSVEVALDDARHHFLLRAHREAPGYDIIASMPFHPWVAASLYTKEFFELAGTNLEPGGVFSTWFGVWRMDEAAVESLLRAFCSVFPSYVIYYVPETGSYFLVGSNEPLTIDLERLRAVHASPSVRAQEQLDDPYFLLQRVFASGDGTTPPLPAGIVNTDDSAFVEVHAPRSGSTSPVLRDFLPREYLHPSVVPSGQRRELYRELLEQLLGTPGGRIPLRPQPSAPLRARRTLSAVKDVLSREELAYFEGRVAAVNEDAEEARRRLTLAAGGVDGEVARRAELFRALTHPPESEKRREALLDVDLTTEAVLELLELDPAAALQLARSRPVAAGEDALGWFFWKAASSEPGSSSDEDRSTFAREVGARVARSSRLGLLELAERFSREQGWEREEEVFNVQRRSAVAVEVERLVREGVGAGTEGRIADAARILWKAHRLQPGSEAVIRPLVIALVQSGDRLRARELVRDLRFLGRSESHIQSLLDAARRGELAFGPASEDAGDGTLSSEVGIAR